MEELPLRCEHTLTLGERIYLEKIIRISGCGTAGWADSPQPLMLCCALLCSCYNDYMEKEKEMCCRMFASLRSSSG